VDVKTFTFLIKGGVNMQMEEENINVLEKYGR
jgi:hypothetical protein